jgi:uncharacterized protein YceH (UPF0502 family)
MSATDPLSTNEARILGCLLEKEITLPDYYPLTLNALTAACNQTTNRDPIMTLDENQVRRAVEAMKTRGWIFEISIVGARVSKYRHNLKTKLPGLERPSTSLLCVLLLRGEQTLGELRQRTERLHAFPDLESIEAEIMKLITYSEGPLAACLPAGPGRRVAQYTQLLTGEPETGLAPRGETVIEPVPPPAPTEDHAWRQRMEMEIEILRAQLNRLKVKLGVED